MGLGAAMSVAVYDYLGYYNICHLGDEVRTPEKTIPRAVLISIVVVAAIYMAMNLAFIGVVPWQETLQDGTHGQQEHRRGVHDETLRRAGRHGLHLADHLDLPGRAVRDDARLLANSVRRGKERRFLRLLLRAASHAQLSLGGAGAVQRA